MMIGLNIQRAIKKIQFNSDDNLPLNEPLKFYDMTVTIRCVIGEDTLSTSIFRWSFIQLIKGVKV